METLYWLFQYSWVLLAYIFIMYIWPMVVFRKHLKSKSKTYRFSFCTVFMVLFISTECILLGLLHILYQWLFCLIFYGIFFYSIFRGKKLPSKIIKRFKCLIGGTYGFKSMILDILRFIRKKLRQFRSFFLNLMKGHWFEYIIFGIVFLWGYTYFSYAALNDYSFGCGDVYVHTEWIYNLFNGKIFSAGIYPEGMHFFIYAESALTGVPMYSAILFSECINVFAILVSLYILLKEVFRWRYSPSVAMMICFTIKAGTTNEAYTFSRMQWSMPQEFSYPQMFLCAAFLIKFLRYSVVKKKEKAEKEAEKKVIKIWFTKKSLKIRLPLCLKDDNLLVFMLALATTITIHFYATIMAFFLCLGVAVVYIRRIISRKFLPLVTAIVLGSAISIVPLVVSFFSGIPLQGSLNWAMSVFMPKKQEVVVEEDPEVVEFEDAIKELKPENEEEGTVIGNTTELGNTIPVAAKNINGSFKLFATGVTVKEHLVRFYNMLKETGYEALHNKERGDLYFYFMLVALGLGIFGCILRIIVQKVKKVKDKEEQSYTGYLALVGMGVVCHLFNCSGRMGIPCIMEPYRICTVAMITGVVAMVVPLDFVFDLFNGIMNKIVSGILGICAVVAVYITCFVTGEFRGYLVYQLTRYNSAVMVTKQIVNSMPKDSYTIVSSTDELYQIIGHGFHEELVQFINESEVVSYTIPTDYIYIFVEKNAILRNQDHFCVGPSWFGFSNYYEMFPGKNSLADGLRKQTISEDVANVYFGKFPHSINVYGRIWQRVLLNSKMYVWCQKFNAMYPNELHLYYEDDDFLCYYLHQNPRNLYELAAMDPSVMIAPEDYADPIWPEDYAEGIRNEREQLGELDEDELLEIEEEREETQEEK